MESTLYMDMTWSEIEQAIADNRILIFCVGAIEQHGYHLPTGVDAYLPMEIARRIAIWTRAIVAPCTNYGYKSLLRAGGGPHFVGSIGVRGTTIIALVEDIITNYIAQGWKKILVLDWHLENTTFVFEGVDEAVRGAGDNPDLKVIKIDNPNSLAVQHDSGLMDFVFGDEFPGWEVEHAAIWETSAMMAAFPELVKENEVVDGHPPQPMAYDVLPVPKGSAPRSGVYWKASQARPEKGHRILEAVTEGIIKVLQKEFGDP